MKNILRNSNKAGERSREKIASLSLRLSLPPFSTSSPSPSKEYRATTSSASSAGMLPFERVRLLRGGRGAVSARRQHVHSIGVSGRRIWVGKLGARLVLGVRKVLPHVVRVLLVGVVLGLDVVDLEAERGRVEGKGCAVRLPHVQRDKLGLEGLLHRLLCCRHELGSDTHLAVRPQHCERSDVTMHLGRILLHFGKHVPDDPPL
mmetsp:Transcript_2226/g.6361  ORF Transcript_2226/g.6361 Transcript_2226/m.6361 type:complete len:204 (-) Transcript_2226:266-877(-)